MSNSSNRRNTLIGVGIGVLIVGSIGASMSGGDEDDTEPASSQGSYSGQMDGGSGLDDDTDLEPVDDGPADHFGSGKYEVGVDILPGQYKTKGPEEGFIELCMYNKYKDDTGDSDSLLSVDSTQGPASVTVEEGQFIEISGDCNWTLQS